MTEEQYLAFDRASEMKYEYLDGEAVAMAGGSEKHSRLTLRMTGLLEALPGTDGPCRVYNNDMRVLVAKRQYVYPDVSVSCDTSDHDEDSDIMRFPHLVVEVLSPSTELNDRGKKLNWYKAHPSIQEYVLINTRIQLVEVYRRGQQGEPWAYETCTAGEEIELQSLDSTIAIDELYKGLRIPLPREE
jgi:Uma2 family endonuclease